jgi:2-polyprenyl-3-methyl-5-hydroxy-6-metoxy-1,4-benzoquinol methylase
MIQKPTASLDTDHAWEEFGRRDPYFGVLSHPQFHREALTTEGREEFFQTGRDHVHHLIADIRNHLESAFDPSDALDFGCGVGRLVIPLASQCRHVMGIDVSSSMLEEARRNCELRGLTNVRLEISDDDLTRVTSEYDLVHSFIVLQHIPPSRGERIIRSLLRRVRPGGVAALHLTYGRETSWLSDTVSWMRRTLPLVNGFANIARGRAFSYPMMQMYSYSLPVVFSLLRAEGIDECHLRFTDHGGHLGAMLYAKRGARIP